MEKKERKDTDQLDTLLESLREVQHAHLRRALVLVKKEIKEQREGKRQLDNQSEIASERVSNKERTLALDSLTTPETSYASSIPSQGPFLAQTRNVSNNMTIDKVSACY